MASKYKYYANSLLDYTKKVSEPVVLPDSPILSFHYSRTSNTYYESNFEINPFSEDPLQAEDPDVKSLAPVQKQVPELMKSFYKGMEYDSKGKKIIVPARHNSLPYLFIPHDFWWEYENFSKFPDYDVWYSIKFKEWHKHMIMKEYQTVTYDPMWSVDPKDPYYDYYMYYFSVCLKYFKPWKSGIPTYIFYESNRLYLYILLIAGTCANYIFTHIRPRSRIFYIDMNEDWWIREYENFKKAFSPTSPFSGDLHMPYLALFTIPAASLIMKFRFGPDIMDDLDKQYAELCTTTKEDYYKMIKK